MVTYIKVQKFNSKSSPGKEYWVSIQPDTKALSCDCKGWTIKKPDKPRHCRHLDLITDDNIRYALGLKVGSPDYNSRAINMADPDPLEISHAKQWWSKRKIVLSNTYVPTGDPELLAKYKMVIVVRSDINLSKGKVAAQVGHAVTILTHHHDFAVFDEVCRTLLEKGCDSSDVVFESEEISKKLENLGVPIHRGEIFTKWHQNGMRKIVLKVSSEDEIHALVTKAKEAGIPFALVDDAGLTEIAPGTVTCCGFGPATRDEIDPITGHLKML